jgi:proteasome lid subunit RPN8/RPN11
MAVQLSSALQGRIFDEMQQAYPNEGGGFLLGHRSADTVEILDVIHIEQYHRYAMTPLNWAKMEDEADERGLTLVGYYHSHPDSPAIPSEYDRVHALPNFTYIITSVYQAKAIDQFAYQLKTDRSAFDTLELVIA